MRQRQERDRWEERKIRKDRKQRYTEAASSQEEERGRGGKERDDGREKK